MYIEGTVNAGALINRIKFTLNSGQFDNKELHRDWDEMGEDSFFI